MKTMIVANCHRVRTSTPDAADAVRGEALTEIPLINATWEATATGASVRWLVVSSMKLSMSSLAMVGRGREDEYS